MEEQVQMNEEAPRAFGKGRSGEKKIASKDLIDTLEANRCG